MIWKLAEAKNKLSEVANRARDEGPQVLTRRDEEYVLLTRDEYRRLTGEKPNFIEFLMSGPGFEGVILERNKRPLRDIEL
ncbi:MAG: type II toxin-antitoxin system prevent-host-death family antitoxin [Chloroflexia bacterium]|jgi:prevent-host-death family protein|nr:type II toxin-antitoxin system prevent-host-death family antitoxin [Chloroflexia bacterium]